MKKAFMFIILAICLLTGCGQTAETSPSTENPIQTEATQEISAGFTELLSTEVLTTDPTVVVETEPTTFETEPRMETTPSTEATQPTVEESSEETAHTQPASTSKTTTESTVPPETQPAATEPSTEPVAETTPPVEETQPPTEHTEPETEPPVETTEPEVFEITAAYKREVAQYALQYINQYRTESGVQACTYLPGMTQVAEYRADQLTYNYSHSTSDKRAALAYYQYGRWVDATLAGLDESCSYYEADSAEAICAGFKGSDAEALGAYIARLVRNSSSHWSYIGSSEYSYIGIGVEYREGSQYGWYACVMVGKVNYG